LVIHQEKDIVGVTTHIQSFRVQSFRVTNSTLEIQWCCKRGRTLMPSRGRGF
jgi:hypothetical protein